MTEDNILDKAKKEADKVAEEIKKIFSSNMEVEDCIEKVFTEIDKLKEIWHYGERVWLLVACMKHITQEYNVPYFIVDMSTRDKRRSKKAMEIFLAAKPIGIEFSRHGLSTSTLFFLPGATTPYQSKRDRKIITTVRLPAGNKVRFVQRDYPHLANVPAIENIKKGEMEPFSELHGNVVFKELNAPIGHFTL